MLFFFFPIWALAQTPALPDPPGLLQFETKTLRTIEPVKAQVPESCDSNYRSLVELRFQEIWGSCKTLGEKEPSDCQRGLFAICTSMANQVRGQQVRTCASMLGAADALAKVEESSANQLSVQKDNAALNKQSAMAIRQVEAALRANAGQVQALKSQVDRVWAAGQCALSSSREDYSATVEKVSTSAQALIVDLQKLADEKEQLAQGYDSAQNASNQNAGGLKTAAVNTMPLSSPGHSGGSNSGVAKRLLPAVAIAAPIALLGLGLSSGSSLPGAAYVDSSSSPIPGSGTLESGDINVEPSFTDRERTVIAAAFMSLPECRRNNLKGMELRRKSLNAKGARGGNACMAGLWTMQKGKETIFLDPVCGGGISAGVVVHEYMHALGYQNGRKLYGEYLPIFKQYPDCPVSPYGAKSISEDFAEAGRLGIIKAGVGSKACISQKISRHKQLIESCQ